MNDYLETLQRRVEQENKPASQTLPSLQRESQWFFENWIKQNPLVSGEGDVVLL